jgi:hypothetical protein
MGYFGIESSILEVKVSECSDHDGNHVHDVMLCDEAHGRSSYGSLVSLRSYEELED